MSTSQESITPQNETTSKPESDDAKTSKQDSDPHLQEKTPSKNEATSKTEHDLAADAETPVQESTSVENETASKDSSPPKITATHEKESITPQNETTSKPESNDAKTSKQDSDPHSQEKTRTENETTPKTKDDLVPVAETPVQESTSVENETAFKDSSPPKIAATHEKESITPQNETTSKSESSDAKTSKQDSDPHSPEKTPSENETTSNCKKMPMLRKCTDFIRRIRKKSVPKSPAGGDGPIPPSDSKEIQSLEVLPNLIQADVEYIEKGARNLKEYGDQLNSVHKQASNAFKNLRENGDTNDLTEMRKTMMKLKLQIPTKLQPKKNQTELEKISDWEYKVKQTIADRALSMIPQLYNNDVFESSIEFKDFEVRYNMLSLELKLCLFCFSIFPEKAIIKKRLMLQWWVAEGFVCEDNANKCFMELITKGFIEPVNNKKSLDVGLCQMHPFYRSALITLAGRAKFFNFDKKGMPTQNFVKTFQACLVGDGLISYEDFVEKKDLESVNDLTPEKKISIDDVEKIHLLMNVKEQTLDFKPQWFSKMTNVNLLYLGRWSALPTDHIEVEDTNFLEGLANMQYMKFLSLQGVSNIISLPDSVLQLKNVKILDLRACYNLETLPEGIGLLKSLTHLDMSECYLLNHMPKSLSSLLTLKVLKGFVIGSDKRRSSCEIGDLRMLKKLIKLSIYTGLEKFPENDHVRALEELKELKKLTITWGRDTGRAENGDGKHEKKKTGQSSDKKKTERSLDSTSNGSESTAKLPSKLEKLDLKCFPMSKTPSWLEPKNLKDLELKKLYIRGGKFSDLGQYQDWNVEKKYTWKVEKLHLKYLSQIELEWRQLQELFPDLVYLEQVCCPKLTLVPCDTNGLWIKETKPNAS